MAAVTVSWPLAAGLVSPNTPAVVPTTVTDPLVRSPAIKAARPGCPAGNVLSPFGKCNDCVIEAESTCDDEGDDGTEEEEETRPRSGDTDDTRAALW